MITQRELQSSLLDLLGRRLVPGASVAILQEGEVIAAAAGVTSVSTGVELTTDTVMQIGSIGKVLNATLVMQLVDEGLVDLDEPVASYWPEFVLKDREAGESVTLRMLLNHTSGIDGEALPDHGHDEETIEKGVGRVAKLGQLFRPGSDYSYCNVGTVVAGFIAQRVRGTSWYRLIRDKILEPLELRHAATTPEEALLYRAAVGHFLRADTGAIHATSVAFCPLSFAPAGATLMMSAKDLISFARAHLGGGVGANGVRILSADSVKMMQTIAVDNTHRAYAYPDGMGLGWKVSASGLLHHAGGGPGVLSVLYVHPARNWAAAVLTNADHGLSLINELMTPWLAELRSLPPYGVASVGPVQDSADRDLERFVGVYEDIATQHFVSLVPDGLMLSRRARFSWYDNTSTRQTPPAPLLSLGGGRFLLESGDGLGESFDAFLRIFEFRNPDGAGRMQHLGNCSRLYKRVS